MSIDPVAHLLDELQDEYDQLDMDDLTGDDVLLILAATRYIRSRQQPRRLQGRPHLTLLNGGRAVR